MNIITLLFPAFLHVLSSVQVANMQKIYRNIILTTYCWIRDSSRSLIPIRDKILYFVQCLDLLWGRSLLLATGHRRLIKRTIHIYKICGGVPPFSIRLSGMVLNPAERQLCFFLCRGDVRKVAISCYSLTSAAI